MARLDILRSLSISYAMISSCKPENLLLVAQGLHLERSTIEELATGLGRQFMQYSHLWIFHSFH